MVQAVRIKARVQAGGRIAVQDSALPEGAEAEVIVLLSDASPEPAPRPLRRIVGSGTGLFSSAHDADAYVKQLRDEWDGQNRHSHSAPASKRMFSLIEVVAMSVSAGE